MSLIVACPNCQTRYNLPPNLAGKKIKCKSCGKPFAAGVGAAKAKTGQAKQVAKQTQRVDPNELAKLGIGAIKQQPDPFAAPAHLGPDPLRNHVVQDPGFEMPAAPASQTQVDDETVNDELSDVTANPYIKTIPSAAAAKSSGSSNKKNRRLVNASWGSRLGGNFLDGIFINIVGSAGFGLGLVFVEMAPLLMIVMFAVTGLFMLLYYPIFETIWGRTVGKFMLGTKVISVDGSKASFVQVLGRTVCRMIPLEPFSMLLCDDKSRPDFWHDSIPQTRVVQM